MKYFVPVLCAISVCAQTPQTSTPPPASTPAQTGSQNAIPAPKITLPKPLGPPSLIVSEDTVVLTIGDQKLTKAQFEQLLAGLSEQQRAAAATPAGRKRLAESFAELTLLAQEGRTRKIDQQPKVQTQLRIAQDQVIANATYNELANETKPDDKDLQAYYDAHKQEYETVKAEHILIRFKGSSVPIKAGGKDLTEEEALAKIKELREKIVSGGAKFEDVAKAESDDTGTATHGGDLGPAFPRGRMVGPFDKVAFEAKVGEVTEPVKTQFGYHIILVTSHETKTFDQVKAEIEQKMKPVAAQKALTDLKKKTNIVFDDVYFGK